MLATTGHTINLYKLKQEGRIASDCHVGTAENPKTVTVNACFGRCMSYSAPVMTTTGWRILTRGMCCSMTATTDVS